ncbi:MAG: aldo/keto reductase [Kosmotoga sp.]|nr:MAG: aldo/keto reductase [Kosmotoga sp.]
MKYNRLGKTDIRISELGLGGFHLLEIEQKTVNEIVKRYLDAGGNYFETAHAYGEGVSEKKLGEILPKKDVTVATKSGRRDEQGLKKELTQSLKNLKRDSVDVLFLHGVTTDEDWEQLLSPEGGLKAIEWAKKEGLIRYVGITSHGYGGTLLRALKEYDFDVFMTQMNYYDRFNFPEIETKVIPYAVTEKIGILAMKFLADGYLYKNVEDAFRYVKTLPVDCIVAGINSIEQLEQDLSLLDIEPYDEEGLEDLFMDASELGNYVCRQCMKCLPCPEGINIPRFFLAEGRYDRQMLDGVINNAAEYALKARLSHWFENEDIARIEYNSLTPGIDKCTECNVCSERCPYDIDVPRKLKIVKSKLETGYVK